MILSDASFVQTYRATEVRDETGRARALCFDFESFDRRTARPVELAARAAEVPVFVRYVWLASETAETAAWARAQGIGLLPLGLRVQATIAACIEAAASAPFLPPRFREAQDGVAAASGELGAALEGLAPGTLLVVLSLPRTGSKALADHLSLWGTPDLAVEHTHSIHPKSREKIAAAIVRKGKPHTLDSLTRARTRFMRFHDMQAKSLHSAQRAYFLLERHPLERLLSSVSLHLSRKDGAASSEDLSAAAALVARDLTSVAKWYDTQYGSLGIRPEDIRLGDDGLQVLRPEGAAPVVILRTERMAEVLRASGMYSDLVGRNSAQERGYADLRARVEGGDLVSREQLDELRRHPWIRRLHPDFAES